jgi:hypothetical protein
MSDSINKGWPCLAQSKAENNKEWTKRRMTSTYRKKEKKNEWHGTIHVPPRTHHLSKITNGFHVSLSP